MRNADIVVDNLKNYIILPGKRYGTYVYPDLNVAMHRLGYNEELKQVANSLSIIGNTAKEANGHEYIGNINWENALKLNLLRNKRTFNLRQGLDFRTLLEKGIDKEKPVHNGLGKKINPKILEIVHDEMFGIRDPWRGELLENRFKIFNNVYVMEYDFTLVNDELVPLRREPLEECLIKDCYANLKSCNRQGMPTKESKKEEFYYWSPGYGTVVWFSTGSDGVIFYCYGGLEDSGSSLGVREIFLGDKK